MTGPARLSARSGVARSGAMRSGAILSGTDKSPDRTEGGVAVVTGYDRTTEGTVGAGSWTASSEP